MRPLRDLQEEATSRVPRGPLGFAGKGNLVGVAGLVGVGVARALVPLSEFEPGYSIESSEREQEGDETVRTFRIHAYSADVAQFVAKRKSVPTNVDFAIRDIEVQSVEPIEKRTTTTEWEIVTVIEDREITEKVGDSL